MSTVAVVGATEWTRFVAASVLCTAVLLVTLPQASGSPARVDEMVRNALQLDANAARGTTIYKEHCAGCHGAAALGNPREVIPALAGQRQAYLIKQLADFAELEREGDQMHAVVSKAALNEPAIWADLSFYLSGLQPARYPETSDGGGVELGEAIYQEQCAACHEEDAAGDADGFVPSLRSQHYSYLVRQMRSLSASHRLNVDPGLVRFLDSFETDEITAVADYLSRLRGPARDRARLNDDGTVRN